MLKTAIKNRRIPEELMDYQFFQEALESIKEADDKDELAKKAARDAAGASRDSDEGGQQ